MSVWQAEFGWVWRRFPCLGPIVIPHRARKQPAGTLRARLQSRSRKIAVWLSRWPLVTNASTLLASPLPDIGLFVSTQPDIWPHCTTTVALLRNSQTANPFGRLSSIVSCCIAGLVPTQANYFAPLVLPTGPLAPSVRVIGDPPQTRSPHRSGRGSRAIICLDGLSYQSYLGRVHFRSGWVANHNDRVKEMAKVLDFIQLGGSERPGLSQACFRLALSNRAYRLQFDVSASEVLASNPRLGSNPVLEDSAT